MTEDTYKIVVGEHGILGGGAHLGVQSQRLRFLFLQSL